MRLHTILLCAQSPQRPLYTGPYTYHKPRQAQRFFHATLEITKTHKHVDTLLLYVRLCVQRYCYGHFLSPIQPQHTQHGKAKHINHKTLSSLSFSTFQSISYAAVSIQFRRAKLPFIIYNNYQKCWDLFYYIQIRETQHVY